MKVSYKWLQSLIPNQLDVDQLAEILTNTGLEVEGVEAYCSLPGGLQGVVVGKVLTCEQHPNADRLKVTTVDIGKENPLHIVCGAPNVAVGQKTMVATVGTLLYPASGEPFTIQKSKIRGEVSEGMLCAEDELGLGHSHAGIIVLPEETEVGTTAGDYYGIYNDHQIEIGLTANRGDAASHLGVARDIRGVIGAEIQYPKMAIDENLSASKHQIQIADATLCRRYCGMYISGVKIQESPAWLKNRLMAIGLKPINNIVDSSNYVMHELGQPTHAFDADQITATTIIVRKANKGEELITLDGINRKMHGHELLIADVDKPLALAGVFGGKDSGVSETTQNIFLESACFDPTVVRKAAKSHTLSTDSSFRFERSTDPLLPMKALHRLALLIQETAGGNLHQPIDQNALPFEKAVIDYDLDKARKLIGKALDNETIKGILTRLDFKILSEQNQVLKIEIPCYRQEVTREADVTEEVLRIYGLNNIDFPEHMKITIGNDSYEREFALQNKVSNMLCSQGFHETMNNSLVPLEWSLPGNVPIQMLNPLSNDLNTLRNHLLHGAMQSISYNRNRKQMDLRLYEFGKTYWQGEAGTFSEEQVLSLAICGNYISDSWQKRTQPSGFMHLKSHIELIAESLGLKEMELVESKHPLLDDAVQFVSHKKVWAEIGYVNNAELKRFDVDTTVSYAQINWDVLMGLTQNQKTEYIPVSKFPEVKRDLSLLLDEHIYFASLEKLAMEVNKKLVKKVRLFDVYRDATKLGESKKSYALSFHLCDTEKTLDDATIDKVMNKIAQRYQEELGAVVRS